MMYYSVLCVLIVVCKLHFMMAFPWSKFLQQVIGDHLLPTASTDAKYGPQYP
jgi:hypothetical protein